MVVVSLFAVCRSNSRFFSYHYPPFSCLPVLHGFDEPSATECAARARVSTVHSMVGTAVCVFDCVFVLVVCLH
jgi:hypothetical protein